MSIYFSQNSYYLSVKLKYMWDIFNMFSLIDWVQVSQYNSIQSSKSLLNMSSGSEILVNTEKKKYKGTHSIFPF